MKGGREKGGSITCIRPTTRTESIRLVRHLVHGDLGASRVEALQLPALDAHIAVAQQRHGAVAFAQDDAVVDRGVAARGGGEAGVDGDVDAAQRVLVFAVEVAALGRLADAVEAVDLEVRRQRQARLERVDPFPVVLLVPLDFGAGVGDAVRVVVAHLALVPRIAVLQQVFDALFDGEVRGRMGRVALPEVDEVAVADFLPFRVIRRPVVGSPDCIAAFGKHAGSAGHGAEDLAAFFSGKEFLETVDGECVELGGILHFAGQKCRHAFESAKQRARDIDP